MPGGRTPPGSRGMELALPHPSGNTAGCGGSGQGERLCLWGCVCVCVCVCGGVCWCERESLSEDIKQETVMPGASSYLLRDRKKFTNDLLPLPHLLCVCAFTFVCVCVCACVL